MKKILHWITDNILFVIVIFLLFFLPLYPKKPLLDVVNTWVYIRAEDFIVGLSLLVWFVLLVKKKITLRTPLTMPILLFWIVGALATVHGILLIFPTMSNVFPNVALLSLLRRIEYLSLFFIGYAAIKDKKYVVHYIVGALALTLLGVSLYGVGQKYLGFPAYLTMNEEFAKGIPIQLSALGRVPSTFGGHYDLAAYLVLVIPILASMIFAFRNWFIKIALAGIITAGVVVLFWTVSRVSFFVLLVSLAAVFFFQKRKWFLISVPIIAILIGTLLMYFSPRILERFHSTVDEVDVLVDARTGEALGNIKEIDPKIIFDDKKIKHRVFKESVDIEAKTWTIHEEEQLASASGELEIRYLMNLSEDDSYIATKSGYVPYSILPRHSVLLVPPNASTGENLPQGTGYINLALSPVRKQYTHFFFEKQVENSATPSGVLMLTGEFLVKRASAYDLSLTTRYQGEWPNAIAAFKRNIFFGSGYSSISLAIDNSYLRMLGEVGALGFLAFLGIFVAAGVYIRNALRTVDSPVVRSYVIGFCAGVLGLVLNATLIDVFEASKVAFYLWLLMGITLGVLHFYQSKNFVLMTELKKIAVSSPAIITYLSILTCAMLFPMLGNYFVGDDFTWLRWAAESNGLQSIIQYFTQSDGFFYRPGTKLFFLGMYSMFWLNPVVYHVASLVIHVVVVALVYLLSKRVLKETGLAALAAVIFAMLTGYAEAVFWIASIGHLFSVMFVLLSVLFYANWYEKKKFALLVLSIVSIAAGLLFHELAVIAPLLMLLYKYTTTGSFIRNSKANRINYALLASPIVVYLLVRFAANSHWSGGDYSYNLVKLPLNFVGNFIGYFSVSFLGPMAMSLYESLRSFGKDNMLVAFVGVVAVAGVVWWAYPRVKKMDKEEARLYLFGLGTMVISLLPFLGLGNITSRYAYLASFGFVIIFVLLVRKFYQYLLHNGRDIAVGMTTLVLSIFFLLHIIQMQQIHNDWREAGIKVNRFFISIQGAYKNYWSTDAVALHFVDVPIKSGTAWVWPVGLSDAVWFNFNNPKIRIYQWETAEKAWASNGNPVMDPVLQFDDFGRVNRLEVPKPGDK